jgi:oxidase EvaA
MTDTVPFRSLSPLIDDRRPAQRVVASAVAGSQERALNTMAEFHAWFERRRREDVAHVRRIPLDDLVNWHFEPGTGDLAHDSGKFFTVMGLQVRHDNGPVPSWTQPIIDQPEIGILGILVKEINGVLHCLMQAKNEPGNCNGVQLSPTVQATRSNYTRVHGGKPVPYLSYFQRASGSLVLADVLQSEQGSWFYRKRNRNMVIETTDDVEVRDDFCWLTLDQVHRLLAVDDLINMDARTVLSCMPFSGDDLVGEPGLPGDGFREALRRSCSAEPGSLHTTSEILRWITEVRTRQDIRTTRIPLDAVAHWHRGAGAIAHESGQFFEVIGLAVRGGNREVAGWTQPMIAPCGEGVVAFLVKPIGGVLHALVRARVEPGYLDVIELAATVHCLPANYDILPPAARPPFLDEVLSAEPERIRFSAVHSEEGGRFYHARNRYMIIETGIADRLDDPDFRWMTLHQLIGLLQHSHYVNVQARSLIACLHALSTGAVSR